MKATAVIPAHNEAGRIIRVLSAVSSSPLVDQVIVVDDGSQDDTAEVAAAYNGALVSRLPRNRGKARAMWEGARLAQNGVVVFLDADLIGLTPEHVASLIEPVFSGEADMCVGQFFQGPPWITSWMRFMPAISGQRAMHVSHFLAVPHVAESGYGVEVAITRYALRNRLRTRYVPFPRISHVMKEEKRGLLRGLSSRGVMYFHIARSIFSNGYQDGREHGADASGREGDSDW